tara:strand:- start:47 stop:196 length:150 start_codon:yes stop_codon:yes gene_type:complete
MKTLLIGISIGISLVHIFGIDVIESYWALVFLGLAGFAEMFEQRKKKKK